MTDFITDMKAQLDAYREVADEPVAGKKKTSRANITFSCESSGVDMVVSRIAGGKTTMKLYVVLSQLDGNGMGTMFIKTMKDGTMKDASVDAISTFFNGMAGSNHTDSNIVPWLHSGKKFAERLYAMRDPDVIALAKEGLLNAEILDKDQCQIPWYISKDGAFAWRSSVGCGVEDRHAKLLRHAFEVISEKNGVSYSTSLTDACSRREGSSYCVWAFSLLADMFDEPFAMKCFDEYIDNARLNGLTYNSIRAFVDKLVTGEQYRYGYNWSANVAEWRAGHTIVNLEKNRFWEYIQSAVGVGLGRSLDSFLGTWGDYLVQAYKCDGKVRDKYPENLQVVHDIYTEKYRLMSEFAQEELLTRRTERGAKFIDQTHGKYQLKTLRTVKDFLEEAQQNCNCVASYVAHVTAGKCWVASFRPVGSDATQLTIEINPVGKMVQIKGRFNREPSPTERAILEEFQQTIYDRIEEEVKAE